MRLWTFQPTDVSRQMATLARYEARWELISCDDWKASLRWMAAELKGRGIPIGERAPVWAWHSKHACRTGSAAG